MPISSRSDARAGTGEPATRATRIDVGWGSLEAIESGDPGGKRLLCLHGWMDNAASFLPLAHSLPRHHWMMLDYAGHGRSDHRPGHSRYYFMDYVFDLDAALDALGWESCTLLGHSLGTAVAAGAACADPQRIERMVMLDGLGVVTEPEQQAAERLTRSLRSVRHPRDHRRVFDSVELAARARQLKNPMADSSARLLAERALRPAEGGWRWRTDPRAMWDSPYWYAEAHSDAILQGLKCPVLVIYTPVLEAYLGERLAARLERLDDVTVQRLEGGHHLHMDQPETLSATIDAFINQEDLQHD
jgi:pimeloyl-ACP methyl ester carboxylesterase